MADEQISIKTGGGPIDCPRFHVNTFQAMASPTEVTLLCLTQVAGVSEGGEIETGNIPAVQVGFSIPVAKELVVLLVDVVSRYEKEVGEIITPYLKERAGK